MKITISIKTDNEAFQEDYDGEINRILGTVRGGIYSGYRDGSCRDTNGNTVGSWKVTGK